MFHHLLAELAVFHLTSPYRFDLNELLRKPTGTVPELCTHITIYADDEVSISECELDVYLNRVNFTDTMAPVILRPSNFHEIVFLPHYSKIHVSRATYTQPSINMVHRVIIERSHGSSWDGLLHNSICSYLTLFCAWTSFLKTNAPNEVERCPERRGEGKRIIPIHIGWQKMVLIRCNNPANECRR